MLPDCITGHIPLVERCFVTLNVSPLCGSSKLDVLLLLKDKLLANQVQILLHGFNHFVVHTQDQVD